MAYEQWRSRMEKEKQEGTIDRYVEHELFDMTWWSTGDVVVNSLDIPNSNAVRLLDLGSGWGRVAHAIKTRCPNISYVGVELTKELAETSKLVLKDFKNVNINQGDFFVVDIEKMNYSHAMSLRVLHYFTDKQKHDSLEKLRTLLTNDGKIFIAIPNKYCPLRWFTYKHAPLFSGKKLLRMIEEHGFKVDLYGSYNFLPPHKKLAQRKLLKSFEKLMRSTPILKYLGGMWFVTASRVKT